MNKIITFTAFAMASFSSMVYAAPDKWSLMSGLALNGAASGVSNAHTMNRISRTGITLQTPVKDETIVAGNDFTIKLKSFAEGSFWGLKKYNVYLEPVDLNKGDAVKISSGKVKDILDVERFLLKSQNGKGQINVKVPNETADGKYFFILEVYEPVPGFKSITKRQYKSQVFSVSHQ